MKLYDSELKVMEVLWENGVMTAGRLAKLLREQTGWSRNTSYTVISKLVAKGAIERTEPSFTCRAAITREQVQQYEANELIGKLYDGSPKAFLSAFLSGRKLSKQEIDDLKDLVDGLK